MESALLVRLLEALSAEAARIAKAPVTLVSVTFDWMAPPPAGAVTVPEVTITRATRTLVFSSARLRAGETLAATATAVHRIEV